MSVNGNQEFFLTLSALEFQQALAIYLDHDPEEAMHFIKEKIVAKFLGHSCKRRSGPMLGDPTCKLRTCRTTCCRSGGAVFSG